jgi:O-antigen/teichoic acid export membrane protein
MSNAPNDSTSSPTVDSRQVTRKTAQAVIWNYASFGLGKFLTFISTAILARLLTVNDFGLVGFATLTIGYLTVLKDLGLGAALIQRRENVSEAANTVFTLNLLLGLLLTGLTILIAPWVAIYFREPQITPMLRVLGLTFAFNAIGNTHVVMMQRELAFNRKLVPDLGRSIVKGLVAIGCALAGFGAWALIIGQLTGVLIGSLLAWYAYRWRPRLTVDLAITRKMLGFGSSVFVLGIVSALASNADYLVVGRYLGSSDLGIYTLAYRLPELLVIQVLWVVAGAIFPAYSTLQDSPHLMRQGFLVTIRYVEIFSVPLCIGLILTAEPLVRVAFGAQWMEAVPIVRIIALFVLISSIGFNAGDVYKANGRPDILVKLSFITLPFLLFAFWYGAVNYGLIGVALAHLITSLFDTTISLYIATRLIQVSWLDIARQLKPAAIGSLGLLALAVPVLFLTYELNAVIRLVSMIIAGAAGYLGVLWMVEKATILEAYHIVFKRQGG